MFKMGDRVVYEGNRHEVIYVKEHILGNHYDTQSSATGIMYQSIPESELTLISPKLKLVNKEEEPTIELSYQLKLKGYHLNFTHKELKEIQTLLNGILL